VLDVACGRGAVLVPAATRTGPTGRVLGVDLSPVMVRLARERIDRAGVPAEVEVMDAEQLPAARLDRLRVDANEHIEAMRVDGGIPLRLEAHLALGRRSIHTLG
jgi:cyclopropane fatty-acyl-phospholipid synthase-like methyltransferase